MVQPRKEQLKNLKTKYKRFSQVGTLVLSGGPVQTIQNTIGESFYDEFLSSSRTQIVGGAESASPAFLYGGSGPFAVAANSQINIRIPGINNELPVVCTFQATDIVNLGGVPVLTTSRAANRINLTLATFGITSPVALNIEGQLVVKSANATGYTTGSSASITLSDITTGVLQALGFGATNIATATGVSGPTRGLITTSSDGLGGYIQLRSLGATSLEPKNTQMLHMGARTYVPRYLPGQPSFARLQAFPGAVLNGRNFKVTYYRVGPKRPSIITSQSTNKSNFSSISSGDQVQVNLDMGGGLGITVNTTTTFGTITTVQQVIDAVNLAWASATLTAFGIRSTQASVKIGTTGPYIFSNPTTRDSFFVSFNGNTAIHINPPAGTYTTASFITYINNQISLASQTAEGEAVSFTDPSGITRVVIQSKKTLASQSSVQLYPGNPGGLVPGTFMETLDSLGMSPGLYSGTNIAELYGLDEIKFINPSALPNSSITVSFPVPAVAVKLGLSTTQTASQTVDVDKVVVPQSIAFVPEVVEFSEEPDDYDTEVQNYNLPGTNKNIVSTDGVANANLSPILDLFGKINPDFIPRILGSLSLDQVKLGSNLRGSIADQRSARVVTEQNTTNGPILVWQGVTNDSTQAISRIYSDSGNLYITYNASYQSGATPWTRDTNSLRSFIFDIVSGKVSIGFINTADSSPWADSSWKRDVKFNISGTSDSIFGTELLNLGASLLSGTSPLISRLKSAVTMDASNPTLMFEFFSASGIGTRLYYHSISGDVAIPGFFPFTIPDVDSERGVSVIYLVTNAYYDSNTQLWNKDYIIASPTKYATLYTIGQNGLRFYRRTSNTPWTHNEWNSEKLLTISAEDGTITSAAPSNAITTDYEISMESTVPGETVIPLTVWRNDGSTFSLTSFSASSLYWITSAPVITHSLYIPITGFVPRGATITAVKLRYATSGGFTNGSISFGVVSANSNGIFTSLGNTTLDASLPVIDKTITLVSPVLENSGTIYGGLQFVGGTPTNIFISKFTVEWTALNRKT